MSIPTNLKYCCSPIQGQIGQESSPEEYVERLLRVFAEVNRVLKPTGTLWLNIADSYAGSCQGAGTKQVSPKQSSNRGTRYMFAPSFHSILSRVKGCKAKGMIGIPWMLAFRLRDAGWYLRQDICWYKPNAMPESVKDRCTKSYEHIFLLAKRPKYYFNGHAIRAVRRKEIPKPNGSTRPLGIPCIWDRLVQQCIKQVMEPICEAKFSDNSFGFRPNRSVEHAIQRTYCLLQKSHMNYVIEFDIKGFFDNVDHSKLIRQIWAMGIRDKHLIYVIRQILKAPIRISDKKRVIEREKLVAQAKKIQHAGKGRKTIDEVRLYNSMVMGIQNAYAIATDISLDCSDFNRAVMTVLTNRLNRGKSIRLVKTGRTLTKAEKERYGNTRAMRYDAASDEPIYPIGYVQHRKPMARKRGICSYTVEGRKGLHENLNINVGMMHALMREPLYGRSAEYADNRISLYSAQWGKCAVTGKPFLSLSDIHCHHIKPVATGGTDRYKNLVLICEPVHRLVHARDEATIHIYMRKLNLNASQMKKVNSYREKSGLPPIT